MSWQLLANRMPDRILQTSKQHVKQETHLRRKPPHSKLGYSSWAWKFEVGIFAFVHCLVLLINSMCRSIQSIFDELMALLAHYLYFSFIDVFFVIQSINRLINSINRRISYIDRLINGLGVCPGPGATAAGGSGGAAQATPPSWALVGQPGSLKLAFFQKCWSDIIVFLCFNVQNMCFWSMEEHDWRFAGVSLHKKEA